MASIRINTQRLKKDMIIQSDIYNRSGVILVPAGTAVTKEVFDLLTRHFIDEVSVEAPDENPPAPIIPVVPRNTISRKKLRDFTFTYQVAENTLAQNLKDIVSNDKDIDIASMLNLLQSVISKTDGELSLFDMLHQMKKHSSLYSHSINVSLYAQLLARWLGLSQEEIELVSLAGLLHDIGHMKYQEVDSSSFTLHDSMRKLCHEQHPTLGYRILQNKDVDHRVKQAVLSHHERFDQSGFPLGLSFMNINQITRILSIADSYVTLITEEPGYPAFTPFDALKHLQVTEHNKFDSRFLLTFIERVSENYIQHEVRLTDGRVGTIILLNKNDLARPLVQIGNLFMDLTVQKNVSIEAFVNEITEV